MAPEADRNLTKLYVRAPFSSTSTSGWRQKRQVLELRCDTERVAHRPVTTVVPSDHHGQRLVRRKIQACAASHSPRQVRLDELLDLSRASKLEPKSRLLTSWGDLIATCRLGGDYTWKKLINQEFLQYNLLDLALGYYASATTAKMAAPRLCRRLDDDTVCAVGMWWRSRTRKWRTRSGNADRWCLHGPAD